MPAEFIGSPFERAWHAIVRLRTFANQYLETTTPLRQQQWLVPQLRYAVHTLGFTEPSRLQKLSALYTASLIADKLTLSP